MYLQRVPRLTQKSQDPTSKLCVFAPWREHALSQPRLGPLPTYSLAVRIGILLGTASGCSCSVNPAPQMAARRVLGTTITSRW